MKKRVIVSLVTGSILGIFCIIGAYTRFGGELSTIYLFSFWFNRFIMGFFIGLLAYNDNLLHSLIRGAFVGLLISFAFYSATEFKDLLGFLVGAVYGVIIEFAAYKLK